MAGTETVTILFTDMVGSTAMSTALDPAAADAVRHRHFALLRQALAECGGTEVKNLGDGLMATFTVPSAAISCAVAMQQAVDRENRDLATPVGLRVGLSGGEATAEDGDYFGDPVVEAARICASCDSGQVLVAGAVRLMAGRRTPHAFADLGERELKGLGPVQVFEVAWEPVAGADGAIPLPERFERDGPLFGLVGRQAELAELETAVKLAASGGRRTVLLAGEPGIGKTTLCHAVARQAHLAGATVLYGRCDEDLAVPYQPFAEALGHLVVHVDEALLDAHAADTGGALLRLVPALARRLPELRPTASADPDSERLRLFIAVVDLLARASAGRGMLLVLDDLHWADKASLQLLRHVAASGQLPCLAVVGTYRDSELSATHPLADVLATLWREPTVERMDLAGLTGGDIVEMMERLAGHSMEADGVELAHALRRETAGNAFFTTEVLRHLGESGLVYQDDSGRWVSSTDLELRRLPQSVREVVGQRVDRLGATARQVLARAAVIGREFDLDLLVDVAGLDEDEVLDVVDAGVQAGLLNAVEHAVDRFSFAHALSQHTLYHDIGTTRRARVHRSVAEALERLPDAARRARAAELARHFVGGARSEDVPKAIAYSRQAGETALAQSAPADALVFLNQAVELYDRLPEGDEALRCDLLTALGAAQCRTSDPAYRQTLLDAADIATALGDAPRLVGAALANTRAVSSAGNVDEARIGVVDRALAALGPEDGAERALLLATKTAELSYIDDRRLLDETAAAALEMAKRLDDPMTLLRVSSLVYHGYVVPSNVDQRLDDLGAALTIAARNADPAVALHLHNSLAIACLQAGESTGFRAHLRACADAAEHLDQPHERWTALALCCNDALVRADAAAAEGFADRALAVGADGVSEAMTAYGVQLIEIRRLQGRLAELNGMCDAVAATAAENPGLPVLQLVLARMYCDLGRLDEARSTNAEAIALGIEPLPYDYTWLPGHCVVTPVLVALGLTDAAEAVYRRVLPWEHQIASVGVTAEGPAAEALGALAALLGDLDAAEAHYRRALALADRFDAPFWALRARTGLAGVLGRRQRPGDEAAAAALLAEAADDATRRGIAHLLPAPA